MTAEIWSGCCNAIRGTLNRVKPDHRPGFDATNAAGYSTVSVPFMSGWTSQMTVGAGRERSDLVVHLLAGDDVPLEHLGPGGV
jgi:hypothetical protein